MSTGSAVYGMAPAMPPERRFYRRIAPSKLVYVAFGADNLGMLVNASESGLMVSTPERLALNSVFRVELHLNGLAKTIKVHVRTVWTEGLQKRSGIQLLDLSENDREQIRKWGRQQVVRNEEPADIVSPETMVLPELAETSFETLDAQPVREVQQAISARAEYASPQQGSGFVAATPFIPALPASLSLASLDMDHLGNDLAPAGQNVVPSRTKGASSKVVLIVWSASMAAICMATGWSYRHELGDRFSKFSAQSAGAPGSAGQSAPVVASDPTVIAPDAGLMGKAANVPGVSGSSPREAAAADVPDDLAANAADEEKFRSYAGTEDPDAPAPQSRLSVPATQHRQQSRRIVERLESSDAEITAADSEMSPMKNPVRGALAAAPAETRPAARIYAAVPENTRPLANTSAAVTQIAANISTPAPSVTKPAASASVPAAIGPQTIANSFAQPTVETRPTANVAAQVPVQTRPAANTAVPMTSSPKVLSVDTYPVRSAITGSISPTNSDRLRNGTASNGASFVTLAATLPATSRSTNSSANTTLSAHVSASYVDRSSPAIQMDVPAARVVELTSTSHTASFVLLPGEQVLKSNAMTIHVRRSVRVPGDHWLLWRAHKKVVLGGLTSRVDPQIPHAPASYGTITIQATIAEDGQVLNVKPKNGNLALLSDVTSAVNEWRYEPTYLDNRQVETQAEIEIDFHPVAPLRASKR